MQMNGPSDFWRWVHKGDDVAFTTNVKGATVKVEFKSTDGSNDLPFETDTIEDIDFHKVTSKTVKFMAWCYLVINGVTHEYEGGGQGPCAGCPHNP